MGCNNAELLLLLLLLLTSATSATAEYQGPRGAAVLNEFHLLECVASTHV